MIFLRGREITGRHIVTYEQELKFNRRILSGKRVLNFGSGESSLKQDIEKMNQTLDKRVSTQITEVDINFLVGKNKDGNFIQANGYHLPFKKKRRFIGSYCVFLILFILVQPLE